MQGVEWSRGHSYRKCCKRLAIGAPAGLAWAALAENDLARAQAHAAGMPDETLHSPLEDVAETRESVAEFRRSQLAQ